MNYTINQLAQLAGVSARTLRYYDQIGLLKPSFIARNGYRTYQQAELIRLQHILFFRELDFSLADIRRIIDSPDFHVLASLEDQKALLQLQKKRLTQLIKTINTTITRMNNNEPINNKELYDAFADDDIKEYQAEAKERWGNTNAYKQSMERVSKMTKAEMDKLKADGKKFTQTLADHMDLPVDHSDVQALIEQHYQGINFFYDCSLVMYRNLGQMYVDDPRFTAYYEKFRPGLAVFMRDAIAYYCDAQ